MRACCANEARRHVKRHREVAVCDRCGRLVLGYGNEAEWKKTRAELEGHGIAFETARQGALWLIAKERAAAKAPPPRPAGEE